MKTVIEMAREADIEWDLIDEDEGQVWYITKAGLERLVELARADEREACAKYLGDQNTAITDKLAAQIRARSNT